MIQRQKIREATIQLLYSLALDNNFSPSPEDLDIFWQLNLLRQKSQLCKDQVKALSHHLQDRVAKLTQLDARLTEVLPTLKLHPELEQLVSLLETITEKERSLSASYQSVLGYASQSIEDIREEQSQSIAHFFEINSHLLSFRQQALQEIEKNPHLSVHLEAVAATLRKMQQQGKRLDSIAHPCNHPEDKELTHLRREVEALTYLQEETNALALRVLENIDAIDDTLYATVQNYAPERLMAIDRAILRLATYELLFPPYLPVQIAISQAIILAESFSDSTSARFINGILAEVALKAPTADKAATSETNPEESESNPEPSAENA